MAFDNFFGNGQAGAGPTTVVVTWVQTLEISCHICGADHKAQDLYFSDEVPENSQAGDGIPSS
jgi:hypothetical protein